MLSLLPQLDLQSEYFGRRPYLLRFIFPYALLDFLPDFASRFPHALLVTPQA